VAEAGATIATSNMDPSNATVIPRFMMPPLSSPAPRGVVSVLPLALAIAGDVLSAAHED
jgi:hypothetical protein